MRGQLDQLFSVPEYLSSDTLCMNPVFKVIICKKKKPHKQTHTKVTACSLCIMVLNTIIRLINEVAACSSV